MTHNWIFNKVGVLSLACLLTATSLDAHASCAAADLEGAWRVFNAATAGNGGFGRGTLVFTATGALNTSKSSVTLSNGIQLTFASGQVRMQSNCNATGSATTTLGVKFNVVDARMDRQKTVISGVYSATNGDAGIINLAR